MRIEAGRFAAYRDYELMDGEYPEVSSALDIIAEFSTQSDDPQAKSFTIQCEDEELANYLTEKAQTLLLDHDITGTAREIAKFGCAFWELIAGPDGKIGRVKQLIPTTMIRNEDNFGILQAEAFTQIDPKTQTAVAHFAAWQVVQGRYIKQIGRMYGSSILESGRRVYKQLSLIEDGMVVARLYRANMRYVFGIPVDGMSPQQADDYLEKKKQDFRKKQRFNPSNNKVEMFDSPIGADEDFFIGVRKEGVAATVETIQGQGELDKIGDVEYFQQKLFACMKVPKGLLNFEKDINAKSTLLVQDQNFARMLRRIQQIVAHMVKDVLLRCMILDGYDPEKVQPWAVVMPEVSTRDEQLSWQIEALKANVALVYGQKLPLVDREYIYKQIMKLSQDEIDRLMALDPSEIGIQSEPMPAFGPPGGSSAGPGGFVTGGPTEQERYLEIPEDADDNKGIVRAMRNILELPSDDPISEEELKLAGMLRGLREEFGDAVDIDFDVFAEKYPKRREVRGR